MAASYRDLFRRTFTLADTKLFSRRTSRRWRSTKRREVFAAQFCGTAVSSRGDVSLNSLCAAEQLEFRLAMTVAAETDFTIDNGTITGYSGAGGDIVIPAIIRGQTVTSIGSIAFAGHTSLRSVALPAGVTRIESSAFSGCTDMASIGLPAGLITIGFAAFSSCSSLTTLTFPSSLTIIGESAFNGCSGLTQLSFPASISSIGSFAFAQCSSLTTVSLPDALTTISPLAFFGCTSLRNITLPTNVVAIGNMAFFGCSQLTSVAFSDNLTAIGSKAFANCSSLNTVVFPAALVEIGNQAFENCTGLQSVTLPDSFTSIGSEIFRGCVNLRSLVLPAGLTSVGGGAFAGCSSLRTINFPTSLTSIGEYAFSGCAGLSSLAIPATLTNLGDYAFKDCTGLATVVFAGTPTTFGICVFDSCTSLTSVSLPSGLATLSTGTFARCTSLVSITLPAGLVRISGAAFYDCRSLQSVNFPIGLTTIGDSAFGNCISLRSIALPEGVATIDIYAFSFCTNLTSISLPASLVSIAYQAFWSCTSLTTVMFAGNAPIADPQVFFGSPQAILYYLPQTTGWFSTLAGRPALPATIASTPANVRVTPGYQRATLLWTAPQSTGGAQITDYVIQASSNRGATWTTLSDGVSPLTTATAVSLDHRLTYVFRVAAVNAIGTSDYSLSSAPVIPQTVPEAPTGLVTTAGNGRVSLAWAAPSSNGGSVITDYVIQFSADNGSTWRTFNDKRSAATTAVVTGLSNGASYVFRVIGKNALGLGVASGQSAVVSPRTLPGSARGVLGALVGSGVSVTWAPPISNGGAPITDYAIQYSANNGKTWTTYADGVSVATSTAINGLTAGRRYVFRVAAINAAGQGLFSAKSAAVVM